jgi:hypothetical protein
MGFHGCLPRRPALAEGAALLLREIDRIEMLVSIHIGKSNANGRLGMFVLVLASVALFDCDANRAMTRTLGAKTLPTF